jgi:hypothetical protein
MQRSLLPPSSRSNKCCSTTQTLKTETASFSKSSVTIKQSKGHHITEDMNLQLSFCHETPCTSNQTQFGAPMNLKTVQSNIRFLLCDQMLFTTGNMHSTAAYATGTKMTRSVTCHGCACVSMCIIMLKVTARCH